MLTQKLYQFLAAHENHSRAIQQLRSYLVGRVGQGCAQSQYLAWAGNAQGETLTVLGTDRQLGAAIAQDEDAADRASLGKQQCPPGIGGKQLDFVEGL